MTMTTNHLIHCVTALLLSTLASCRTPSLREIQPPSLPRFASQKQSLEQANDPKDPDFTLWAFSVNEVFGGKEGWKPGNTEPYRAKITLFESSHRMVAELYFYDEGRMPRQTERRDTLGHYLIAFPMTTLSPITQQLRFSTANPRLHRYQGVWTITTEQNETVGP